MRKGKALDSVELLAQCREHTATRRELWADLCKHLSGGFSLRCYPKLGEDSIGELSKSYPIECPWAKIIDAQRQGEADWEMLGKRQANGTCLGNSRTWYYNMSHRYNWTDRIDIKAEHSGAVSVNLVQYGTPANNVSNGSA